jgi:phospholipase C
MPEQLEARGISWKVYTSPDNYAPEAIGDPPFHFFAQNFDDPNLGAKAFGNAYPQQLQQDAANGTLPQVSWVYAPVTMSEHPPAPVNSGEGTTSTVLQALLANPALWAKTVLFVTWDENGGFYDHVAPPTPPPDVHGEWLSVATLPDACEGIRGPIGLGFRVPMLVCSPFSRGGLVCPDRFDHTSMLRFLERRFGVEVPNLGAWRRAIAGDLTAAFDFARPADARAPRLPDATPLGGATPGCALSVTGSQVKAIPGSSYTVPPNSEPQQEAGTARRPSGIPAPPKPKPKKRRKRKRHKARRKKRQT